jgi:hypothetical protein
MVITENQRAGHTIRVKLHALAERVVAQHYRRRPELAVRYGNAGRRHCLTDAEFNLSYLAASIDFGDARVFSDYVAWLVGLLARRRIPAGDVADNLNVIEAVLEEELRPEVMSLVRAHIATALKRFGSVVP